jgi:hypothetical protein
MGICADGQCPSAALQLQTQGGGGYYLYYRRGSRHWALSSGCAAQLQVLLRYYIIINLYQTQGLNKLGKDN